jgi:multicomponent Na+:H+ antiporter subunit D
MTSFHILLPIVLLLIFNLPFGRRFRTAAWIVTGLMFLIQTVSAVTLFPGACLTGFDAVDAFLKVGIGFDLLSRVMMAAIGIVGLAVLVSAPGLAKSAEGPAFHFIDLLLIAKAAMSGVVLSRDLFTVYVFIETLSIASFVLIAVDKDRKGLASAFKYVVMSGIATVCMLLGIAVFLLLAGGVGFDQVANVVNGSDRGLGLLGLGLLTVGLFIKGGLVPFHGWLPDAYSEAPPAVSILLAGIITKIGGIYTLIRLVSLLGGMPAGLTRTLLFFGALSVVVGAVTAMKQTTFKRILSFSSISQVGYIILGFAVGTPLGIAGAVFHLFNHSIFKSLLFVNAAAVEKQTGTGELARLGGLQSRMPVTSATSLVGLLSTAGVPPLSGFWSKLIIIMALWQSHQHVYALIAVLASVLTLAYLLIIQRRVFFGKLADQLSGVKEAGFGVGLAAVSLALLNIAGGLCFPLFFEKFFMPLRAILFR